MKTGGAKRRREFTRAANTSGLWQLETEKPNSASAGLDTKSSIEIARIINREDAKVAGAVARSLPQIAKAIDLITEAFSKGGRLIYVGTGTSGRIAALDAAECPPTFNTNRKMVQFVMAGGTKALAEATEASEDSRLLGRREMAKKKPSRKDVVVGVAASGRTPFTIAAIEYARSRGAKTIAVVCNRDSPLEKSSPRRDRGRSWPGSGRRVDSHESRYRTEDDFEHADDRRDDAPRIRVWQPDGQSAFEER